MVHVSAADALIDPHVTIRHEDALPKKDPGYYPLQQQGTFARDSTRRVITDYTGTPIIKVDQEGGIFDQQLKQGLFKSLSPQPDRSAKVSGSGRGRNSGNSLGGAAYASHGGKAQLSSRFLSMQNALQTVNNKTGSGLRDVAELDSTLSTRGLMQRKLYLMKMMLKNEKQAN